MTHAQGMDGKEGWGDEDEEEGKVVGPVFLFSLVF